MWLSDETFKSVIQHTPLISIDLIVRNEQDEVLLGKRVNAPAKDYWFVPGGRVRKNETLDDAFIRLVKEELGIESGMTRADAKFIGVFEHFYDDCVFGDGISTHYIVLAYEIDNTNIKLKLHKILGGNQHSEVGFIDLHNASKDEKIHYFTKQYLSRLKA